MVEARSEHVSFVWTCYRRTIYMEIVRESEESAWRTIWSSMWRMQLVP